MFGTLLYMKRNYLLRLCVYLFALHLVVQNTGVIQHILNIIKTYRIIRLPINISFFPNISVFVIVLILDLSIPVNVLCVYLFTIFFKNYKRFHNYDGLVLFLVDLLLVCLYGVSQYTKHKMFFYNQ